MNLPRDHSRHHQRRIAAAVTVAVVGAGGGTWALGVLPTDSPTESSDVDTAATSVVTAGTAGNAELTDATIEGVYDRLVSEPPEPTEVRCVVEEVAAGSLAGASLRRLAAGDPLDPHDATAVAELVASCSGRLAVRSGALAALDGPFAATAPPCLRTVVAGLDDDGAAAALAVVAALAMAPEHAAEQLSSAAVRCTE